MAYGAMKVTDKVDDVLLRRADGLVGTDESGDVTGCVSAGPARYGRAVGPRGIPSELEDSPVQAISYITKAIASKGSSSTLMEYVRYLRDSELEKVWGSGLQRATTIF
jgi:hypothetical protein